MSNPRLALLPLLACLAACNLSSGADLLGGARPAASGSSGRSGQGTVDAGVLTAGAWDDNLNFEAFQAFAATVHDPGKPAWSPDEQGAARLRAGQRAARGALDVALVIDTTGSMGDEIAWLQGEFDAIAGQVASRSPQVPVRWALVDYKDVGDPYLVRATDFAASTADFREQLRSLEASGGGDFPEVPDQALARAATLSWGPAPTTARLVFWVADAPHHPEAAASMTEAVRALRALDAHVYPVAASGVELGTEYTMRGAAQLTLGRYLFLTDDSGLGESHLAPQVSCYAVTTLAQALLRMVDLELSGTYRPPDPGTVLRTVGEPSGDGVCTAADGGTTRLF